MKIIRMGSLGLAVVLVCAWLVDRDGADIGGNDRVQSSKRFEVENTATPPTEELTNETRSYAWAPQTHDYVSVYVRWHPGEHRLEFLWAHNRVAGEPFFTGLSEVILADPKSEQTRFQPLQVFGLAGTKALVICGRTVRGEAVVERWTFSEPTISVDSITPGSVLSREDLMTYNAIAGGDLGFGVLYDIANEDPLTGFGAPATLLVKPPGISELLSVDLSAPDGTASKLAGAGPLTVTQSGPQPQFVVPILSSTEFGLFAPVLAPSIGQLCVLRNPLDLSSCVLVIDSDLDGIPDSVTETTLSTLEALGIVNDHGPASGLDKAYFRKY